MVASQSPPVWHREGAAQFQIGDAFFRASSQQGRDLALLAARAYKARWGQLRVLDAMSGCGVRALRYALEANADFVWVNEGNGDLNPLLQQNLAALASERYCLTHQDANQLFFDCHLRQDFYDLIDIDSFGSPALVLSTALWAVKLGGLLYLTSTDGRATSGHAPFKSLESYGAYARAHPAVHEQGLRLLLGTVAQQAAVKGLAATPVFSLYHGEVNRVMVRIHRRCAQSTQDFARYYGFLAYCHHCGQFQSLGWKKLGTVTCACASAPVVSGPLWLGPLHDPSALAALGQILQRPESTWQGGDCRELIRVMQQEATLPPYFFPLAEIGRRGKLDIPPRQALLDRLRQAGYRSTPTHLSPEAIKTEAPLSVCVSLARQLSQ